MLVAPTESPYDLRFRLFGTDVRVHPLFWLFSAIFGWEFSKLPQGMALVAIWVACAFVSILLHEFGHIWAGRAFGCHGHIVLFSLGGLAVGSSDQRHRWQRMIVFAAGPAIQLALYGVLWLCLNYWLESQFIRWSFLAKMAFIMLMTINLYWPLFNLLPVWPLDGGRLTREICQAVNWNQGTRISLGISIAVAGFLAVNTMLAINGKDHVPYLNGGGAYSVIFFAVLALQSFQLLQQENQRNNFSDSSPWE